MSDSRQTSTEPATEATRQLELLTEPVNRLVCADNLDLLKNQADESIDLIYMDPPFGTGAKKRGRKSSNQGATEPMSYADSQTDPAALTAWLLPRFTECHRTLAAQGSMFVHLDYRTVHYVKVALDKLFGRARFVNELIWCYSVGGKSTRRFARKHDTILWYAKTASYAFFPDRVRVPRKSGSHMKVVVDESGEAVQIKTDKKTGKVYRYPVKQGKIPEDWWTDIETLNRSDAERCGWPTQKPTRLLERIILGTTEPGQLVTDIFAGSGTTAVAALRHGRSFIAVDSSTEAVAAAAKRLELETEQLTAAGTPPPRLIDW